MVTPLRVQLVGEDGRLLKALKALLRSAPDMDVLGESAAAEDTLTLAQAEQPDVVLLAMPSTAECLALVRRLVNLSRPPHILVLAKELDETEMSALIDAGVGGYLPVGIAPADILSALVNLYQAGG